MFESKYYLPKVVFFKFFTYLLTLFYFLFKFILSLNNEYYKYYTYCKKYSYSFFGKKIFNNVMKYNSINLNDNLILLVPKQLAHQYFSKIHLFDKIQNIKYELVGDNYSNKFKFYILAIVNKRTSLLKINKDLNNNTYYLHIPLISKTTMLGIYVKDKLVFKMIK